DRGRQIEEQLVPEYAHPLHDGSLPIVADEQQLLEEDRVHRYRGEGGREERLDLLPRNGDRVAEEDVADGVGLLRDPRAVQDGEHQGAGDDVPEAHDGLRSQLAMPRPQRKEHRGHAGEEQREPGRLEQQRNAAVRVRVDAEDGAEPEGEGHAHAGDLAQRGGDEHHPLENDEHADVPEHRPGQYPGDHWVAPQIPSCPEVREAAHGGPPSPSTTMAVLPPTFATRTSRPYRPPSFSGSSIWSAGPTS